MASCSLSTPYWHLGSLSCMLSAGVKRRTNLSGDAEPGESDVPEILAAIEEHIAKNGLSVDHDHPEPHDLSGICLSGGGIRSATFCLGSLQALAERRVFQRLDYLSTVSGGGYTGSSLSSLYADGKPDFPFRHEVGKPEGEGMRHLRNYSSYLAPAGDWESHRIKGE